MEQVNAHDETANRSTLRWAHATGGIRVGTRLASLTRALYLLRNGKLDADRLEEMLNPGSKN
jgi:myosin-crossreactive antigen